MSPPVVDLSRVSVTYHEDGEVRIIPRARFVHVNGRAAVWTEDTSLKTARRVLFATDVTYEPQETARVPNLVHLPDDSLWEVRPVSGGGCGCGSAIGVFGPVELTSDDLVEVGSA